MAFVRKKSLEELKKELAREEKLKAERDKKLMAIRERQELARKVANLKAQRKYGKIIKVSKGIQSASKKYAEYAEKQKKKRKDLDDNWFMKY